MKKRISVILPVYNEADGILAFHGALSAVLGTLRGAYDFEVIYVVDKCRDDSLATLQRVAEESEDVRVLGLSRRFGHQMSLIAGIDACTGDAAVMMDCDMEHPPELIPALLEKYEEGFDVVHTIRRYNRKTSPLKQLPSKLFYKLLNVLAAEKFSEDAADFRLISKKVIDVFKRDIREHNQFLRGLFKWVGFEQAEVPFVSGVRQAGQSKYTLKRLVNFAAQGIVSFSKMPLQVSVVLGIVFAIAGVIYGIYNVCAYFFAPHIPEGWTTIVTLLLFMGGLQLIILGVIGEYISAIFDEVKDRPLYVVQHRYGYDHDEDR
jgi:glycosyltransferase involved in cell wall biosynthesis